MNHRIRARALQLISAYEGLRLHELLGKMTNEFMSLPNDSIIREIGELVKEGEIIEIEYQITGSYTKAFYLPKNSTVKIIK